MDNKKNQKNNSSCNLEQMKPKLIKRDIKLVSNKKENIVPSAFNINKPIKKNSSKNTNGSNSKNKTKKSIIKSREINSARERKAVNKPKKRVRKFKDIDEIVLLLQKHIRKYLYRIHNDPKLQMVRMLKEKKKNLFENYKISNNPILINEFMKEQAEKNKNDENINTKIINDENISDNTSDEKIVNDNPDINIEEKKEIENKNFIKYEIKKSDKLNEDLEGLQDKYDDLSSIDEEILQNYIEEPKEINNENSIINKNKKKRKKQINNFKFELVMEKKNKIDDKQDIRSNEIINNAIDNNIKEENNIELSNNKDLNEENSNNIIQTNKEEIPKVNINNEINKEESTLKTDNLKDNDKYNGDILKDIDISKDDEIPNYKNKEIINVDNFGKNEEKFKMNDIPVDKNEMINQNTEENLNIKTQNNLLIEELNEAKKKLLTMSEVISELKSQLISKNEYIDKNINNINNKNLDKNINQTNLINLLITEKKSLEEKNAKLEQKLSEVEKQNYKKLQKMRDNYELEIGKCKEAWYQTEKIRRKKWESQKIQEIKTLTAKGLQPEIENIISKHKIELSNLENQYLQKMREFQEKIILETEQKNSEFKYKITKEKDNIIEEEKKKCDERIKKQRKIYEDEINEERKRWNSKIDNEIQRLETLREKDKRIYEEQISQLEERNKKSLFSNDDYYKKKFDEIKKEYNDKLKEDLDKKREELEHENNDILEKKKNELDKKYQDMKKELMIDRDKQLNIIIQKLSEESMTERKKNYKECEKKSNEKNILLIEENSELKKKCMEMSNKLEAETKNRINLEQNIELLNKKLKEKNFNFDLQEKKLFEMEKNYNDVNDKLYGLSNEFKKEKTNLELEMKTALERGDAEIILLKNKLESERKAFQEEKKDIINMHKNEIENLEKKIKLSFAKKDEIIMKLQLDNQTKQITIEKYEEMLNRKRKEIYGK